jgi:hypothetical protein
MIGTPTFFVNGRHFHDKRELETLFMAIGFSLLSSASAKNRLASTEPL